MAEAEPNEKQTANAQREVESCGNCKFSRSTLGKGHNISTECRREPPRCFMIGSQTGHGFIGAWPPTRRELWCGNWQPKS
jgi:hypothetical protein